MQLNHCKGLDRSMSSLLPQPSIYMGQLLCIREGQPCVFSIACKLSSTALCHPCYFSLFLLKKEKEKWEALGRGSVGKKRQQVTCNTRLPNNRKWCSVMFSITMRQKFYIHEFKISKNMQRCQDVQGRS